MIDADFRGGPVSEQLHASWSRCWRGLTRSDEDAALRDRLIDAWSEPQRKYHTLQHLSECLGLFEKHRSLAAHPHEVEIALWFHDAIYDVKGTDNEARSASWAAAEMAAAGVASDSIDRVRQLIMATCHAALPVGTDQQLLVDIDLSILGAPRARFDEYESQVRQEYGWVPGFLFRSKRREILAEFLKREPIYAMPELRQELETQARANLEHSILVLGGG